MLKRDMNKETFVVVIHIRVPRSGGKGKKKRWKLIPVYRKCTGVIRANTPERVIL